MFNSKFLCNSVIIQNDFFVEGWNKCVWKSVNQLMAAFREFQFSIWMFFMILSLFSEQIDLVEARGLQNLDCNLKT